MVVRTKEEERRRRAAVTGKFFKNSEPIPYLWTNNIYPAVLIISLLFVLLT